MIRLLRFQGNASLTSVDPTQIWIRSDVTSGLPLSARQARPLEFQFIFSKKVFKQVVFNCPVNLQYED